MSIYSKSVYSLPMNMDMNRENYINYILNLFEKLLYLDRFNSTFVILDVIRLPNI